MSELINQVINFPLQAAALKGSKELKKRPANVYSKIPHLCRFLRKHTEAELVSGTGKLLDEVQCNTLERHRRRKKE